MTVAEASSHDEDANAASGPAGAGFTPVGTAALIAGLAGVALGGTALLRSGR